MAHLKDLIRKLLHIEDTPERTAFAYSVGVFLGFSPFLGFHTLLGIGVAFLFRFNRVAVLLGVWSNTPWWIVPYYTVSSWVGMRVLGIQIDTGAFKEILRTAMGRGVLRSGLWSYLGNQWGLFFSLTIGSLILAVLLSLAAYPLCLRGIRFYRSKREEGTETGI